ncbi:LysM repeat protein [Paenibacillus sp. W4I10]|uniref:LysM peptidoglycan-binding domain-containing protein n=1 Tax=Paenibacillus sp. W4I10 TaxID=3042298 RepID=UPI002787F7C1|nr:LysM peptidoglycan-binding domain-containing protein [Paenibacillus sp. W4I10]MDQ0719813.1 LysM repeat protein [Paenibacillus sp. W4I10]
MIERYNWAPVGGVEGKRYVPIIRVSFHTDKACYQLKGSLTEDTGQDPTSQVLSVTTQKTLDAPAGTMNIVLAGDKWFRSQLIMPNDLVVVQMGYKTIKGEELSTVMVGLVDRVRRTRSVDNGMTTSIQARDFGKVLIKSNIKFYPEISGGTDKFFLTENGWLAMAKYFQSESIAKGSPAVILDVIMRFILPKLNSVKWTVWDEKKAEPVAKKVDVTNILRYNFATVPVFLPQFFTLDRYEGSLWNLMERTSTKPFTELFVDVREPLEAWNPGTKPRVVNETIEQSSDQTKAKFPKGEGYYPFPRFPFGKDNSVVSVFLRNTPFSKDAWDKLLTHEVTAEDVIDEDLSYSDDEHYNLFWAGTTINPFGFDLKRVAPPVMNKSAVERYGLSPLEIEIEGLAIDPSKPEDTTKLEQMSKAYTLKLKEWFENNHKFLNGSMTVRGKGSYKIGQKLQAPGIMKEFYVESVTQTFNVFDGWTTTLQLTRGRNYKPAVKASRATTAQAAKATDKKPASAKTAAEVKADFYTVKRGDSLWSISAKVYSKGDDWTKLWEANKNMLIKRDGRNASQHGKYIYVGQVIKIPGGK